MARLWHSLGSLLAPSWLSSNRAWKTAPGGCDTHRRTYTGSFSKKKNHRSIPLTSAAFFFHRSIHGSCCFVCIISLLTVADAFLRSLSCLLSSLCYPPRLSTLVFVSCTLKAPRNGDRACGRPRLPRLERVSGGVSYLEDLSRRVLRAASAALAGSL